MNNNAPKASILLEHVSLDFPLIVGPRVKADALPIGRSKRANIGGEIVETRHRHLVVRALNDVSISLSPGDRLAIIGSNGSGKSTLLRLVAGLLDPESGKRNVQGKVSTIFNIRLGFMMEQTGYDNIMMRGLLDGHSHKKISQQMTAIADSTGLGDYLFLPLETYSSGMLARLAFSISIAWNASVLLMDEWIGAGDAAFLRMARERLVDYASNVQILLLASHSPPILRQMCNRAIVLSQGRISFSGGVDEALEYFKQQSKG